MQVLTICGKEGKALLLTLTLASRVRQKRVRFKPLAAIRRGKRKGKKIVT
jgi:hypothetical protein